MNQILLTVAGLLLTFTIVAIKVERIRDVNAKAREGIKASSSKTNSQPDEEGTPTKPLLAMAESSGQLSQPHGEGLRGLSPATTAASAKLRWQKPLPRGIGFGGGTFSQDGTALYFKTSGNLANKVYKVRASDGKSIWETDPKVISFGLNSDSGITVDEAAARVYTTGTSQANIGSIIVCFNSDTGAIVWLRRLHEYSGSFIDAGDSFVLLSPDKTRLYIRAAVSGGSTIIAVDAADGKFIWEKNINGTAPLLTFGPVWKDAGTGKTRIAYVNNALTNTVGVLQDEGASASVAWSKNAAKALNYHWWGNGTTNLDNTQLYVPSFADGGNPVFTAFNTANGDTIWQIFNDASKGMSQFQNCAVGADGTIYSPGRKGTAGGLTAIKPDGAIKWQFVPPGSVELTSWPVVTSNGIVYAADQASNLLYGIKDDGTSASLIGSWQLGANVFGGHAPAVGPDGTLYVGSGQANTEQLLYAFGPSTNSIPSILSQTLNVSRGDPTSTFTIAGVSDAETSAQNLTVTLGPLPTGITVTGVTNVSGKITASVAVGTNAQLGENKIVLTAKDSDNNTASADLTVNVVAKGAPSINPMTFTRQVGSTPTQLFIGTVADDVTTAGSLVITASSIPAGITISNIINSTGSVRGNIAVACDAKIGNNSIKLTVTDADNFSTVAFLNINVTANTAPVMGDYPPVVQLYTGAGTTINPVMLTNFGAGGENTYDFSVTAPGYSGSFVNNNTGYLGIVNANPAGSYTVTATAKAKCNSSISSSKSFNLVVTPPPVNGCYAPFTSQPNKIPIPSGTKSVAAADFNNDGKQDLAVLSNTDDKVRILLGDGKGSFLESIVSQLSVGNKPVDLIDGDFNGDGKPDLAVARVDFSVSPLNASVAILLGDGSGKFSLAAAPISLSQESIIKIQIGDFNLDQKIDLVVVQSQSVSILYGDGSGKFSGNALSGSFSLVRDVAIADFNADNKLDLAVADFRKVVILLGNGQKNFTQSSEHLLSDYTNDAIGAGDFNGDGKPDLAVISNNFEASILFGNGNGDFTRAASFGVFDRRDVAIADFNRDGYLDIAVGGSSSLTVALGDGKGRFIPAVGSPINKDEFAGPLVVGDFRGMGKSDLAMAGDDGVYIMQSGCSIPLLQVTEWTAPPNVSTDIPFEVSWTDKNSGSEKAIGPWADQVFLSTDDKLGGDTFLAEFPYDFSLDPNQSATRKQIIIIPRAAIPVDGQFYLIVFTDTNTNVNKGINVNGQWRAIPVNVKKSFFLLPDLIVDKIEAPDTAFFDQTITVKWTVKNIGRGATSAPTWTDIIYLSSDNSPDLEDPYILPVQNVSYLNVGDSYVGSADVHIPRGLVGIYNLIVYTDFDRSDNRNGSFSVYEEDESNNYNKAKPINIKIPPVPDLQTTLVQAPDEARAGAKTFLNFKVENKGTGKVSDRISAWTDGIYLSKDQTWDATDRFIEERHSDRLLDPNDGGYTASGFSINIPPNIAGDWYVIVVADYQNQVYEFTNENNNAGYDMRRPTKIIATPPDLIVSGPLTAPTEVNAARQITVSWIVRNQGAFEAKPGWLDTVYISADEILNPAIDTALDSIERGPLQPSGATANGSPTDRYTATTTVTIPACYNGNYFLYVMTDSGDHIFEYDPTLNAEHNNVSAAKPIKITAIPPDLQVTTVTPAATTAIAGQPLQITWTVANKGTGPTIEGLWIDNIYLSESSTFNVSTALLTNSIFRTEDLNVNMSYTQKENITIPTRAQGNYYLFVVTDAGKRVEECNSEGNNTTRAQAQITISNNLPDLKILAVNPATANAFPGQKLTVSWIGKNEGTAAVLTQSWADNLWLSADQTLSNDDKFLGYGIITNTSLPINSTYQKEIEVPLPIVPAGNWYLIVAADKDNYVFEGRREDNNAGNAALRLDVPAVDLGVINVDAPTTTTSGQKMRVTWTVNNAGTQKTIGSIWTDYILLSRDGILDSTDTHIGYLAHNAELNGGASYNGTLDVLIPNGLSGPYYVFVVTDYNNRIAESDETNNSKLRESVLDVSLPLPVDLTIASITTPLTGTPGEEVTIYWNVRNNGPNTATGVWTDAVYLSKDTTWDINDPLFGRLGHDADSGLTNGTTYTGSLKAKLRPIEPGEYYVIVRTDVRNNMIEGDEGEKNNSQASTLKIKLDVTELTIGASYTSILKQEQEKYFKVNPPANETMSLTLVGQNRDAFNELFVRFGLLPGRNAYDFLYNRPYEPSQEIIVPNTQNGTYYNLAKNAYIQSADSSENSYSIKAEIIPFGSQSISPNKGGAVGEVTVEIKGAKFDYFTQLELVQGTNKIVPKYKELREINSLIATFDLSTVPTGVYDLHTWSEQRVAEIDRVAQKVAERIQRQDHTLNNAFTVSAVGGEYIKAKLILPQSARVGRVFNILAEVTNEGINDAKLPVIEVSSLSGAPIYLNSDLSDSPKNKRQIIVSGGLRKSIIRPNEKVYINLYSTAPDARFAKYSIKQPLNQPMEINWKDYESYFRDESTDIEWNSTWAEFISSAGDNWDQLSKKISEYVDDNVDKKIAFIPFENFVNDLLANVKLKHGTSNLFMTEAIKYYSNKHKSITSNSNNGKRLFKSEASPDAYRCQIDLPTWELSAWESYSNSIIFSAMPIVLGDETTSLWGAYLANTPGSGRPLFSFGDGSDVVERFNGFRKSQEIKSHKAYIRQAIKSRLASIDCSKLKGEYTLDELIPFAITPEITEDILDFGNPFTIPGNIAGGVGKAPEQQPPDTRSVSGVVFVKQINDPCGRLKSLEVRTVLDYNIKDTIDFCPGNDGAVLEKVLTIPLSYLEANGWAYDIGISVNFTDILDPFTVNKACKYDCASENPCSPNSKCSCNLSLQPDADCDCKDCDGVHILNPLDPNDKIGPSGFSVELYKALNSLYSYRIQFENKAQASGHASVISITDQLDQNLDRRTLRLNEIGFGKQKIIIPNDKSFYQDQILLENDFGNLIADIFAGLDITTGQVKWTISAIDPKTGEPPSSAQLGILPPEDGTGRGQGYVSFTILPRAETLTGTIISNKATITFDTEEPITTNTVMNTVDADLPFSMVTALPATSPTTFTLNWTGNDIAGGSGFQNFDIWYAESDGSYQPFLTGTTTTSAPFTGENGKTYRFYSITRDNAGNIEAAPDKPDAVTRAGQDPNPVPTLSALSPSSIIAGNQSFTLTVSGSNFVSNSEVRWNGLARPTTFLSTAQLTAVISSGDVAATGSTNITVFTPTPGGGTSNVLTFTISPLPNPVPTIASLNPNTVTAGGAAFTLAVNGTGFVNGARVQWNGADLATTLVNNKQVTTSVPANLIASAGTATILVINPSPGGGPSNTVSLTINAPTAYEADIMPRPNGNGDGKVTIADWVQAGRLAVVLDTPANGSEFQRVDCAPKSSLGDGKISLADWVQAGRYASGLDPVVIAGGPTTPVTGSVPIAASVMPTATEVSPRTVRAVDASFQRGQIGLLQIEFDSQGNENAVAFSFNYNPALLTFIDAIAGDGAQGATIQVNASQAALGRIGLAVALQVGKNFAAGNRGLVKLRFIPTGGMGDVNTKINFGDQIISREIVDANAGVIPNVSYTGASLTISGRAVATVSAASYVGGEMATDMIASAFGSQLAASTQPASSLPLPISLGGAHIIVKDSKGIERFAPLFYVSPGQINFQISAGTAEGVATLTIFSGTGTTSIGILSVGKVAPALFAADSTGSGFAAGSALYVHADGTRTESNLARFDEASGKFVAIPVELGSETDQVFLTLYGTGFKNRSELANVKVKIGGFDVPVEYAGGQGFYAGLDQLNVRLTRSLIGRGEAAIEFIVDGKIANTVNVKIR